MSAESPNAVEVESSHDKDVDDDDDDEEDRYAEWFQSIQSPTGLEIGIQVTWPGVRPFSLSTTLEESEIAPLFHGTQWAGTRVWSAAVVALQYLLFQYDDDNANQQPMLNIGPETTLLELGCGLGVPGMLLHEITKCSVILSDKQSLVDQLRLNLDKVFPSSSSGGAIEAHALDWSAEGVETLLQKVRILLARAKAKPSASSSGAGFDVVLNCDCVYEPLYGREAWQSLIVCQQALLKANPKTVLITSLERRRADGVEHYLKALSGIAQHVEVIDIPFEHDPNIELYVAHGLVTS